MPEELCFLATSVCIIRGPQTEYLGSGFATIATGADFAMLMFFGVRWKGSTCHQSRLENQAGAGQRGHGSGASGQRERKTPGSRRIRWVQAGSVGMFAANLAAAACLASGQGQQPPAGAKTEAMLETSRPPETADKAAQVESGLSQKLISIDPPARPGSTSPALAVEAPTTVIREHQILMTWLEPGESGRRLRFARLSGRTWSRPITIAEPVASLGPTGRPSLTVIDTQGVRRTLVARTEEVVARSGDGGRTWTRLPVPALPFSSFAGGDEGGYVFWLAADGDQSAKLLGTRVLAGETLVDPRVVGGSGTSAAMTWDGPVVVYRDRNAKGAEDIAIVRRQDARWTLPRPVHAEGWRPLRKLTSGPQVAALRRQVAVAWGTRRRGSDLACSWPSPATPAGRSAPPSRSTRRRWIVRRRLPSTSPSTTPVMPWFCGGPPPAPGKPPSTWPVCPPMATEGRNSSSRRGPLTAWGAFLRSPTPATAWP